MTPEERAAQIREAIESFNGEQISGTNFYPQIDRIIAEHIRAAVADKQEACAALCERLRGTGLLPRAGAMDCAAAIRAMRD